ncbi:hypothetical protein D3C72_2484500 [compost metagenome]
MEFVKGPHAEIGTLEPGKVLLEDARCLLTSLHVGLLDDLLPVGALFVILRQQLGIVRQLRRIRLSQ